MFEVVERKCDQCLFTENRVVSKERFADIVKECREKSNFFICHKSSIEGGHACCRGFFDTQDTQTLQIARRLDAVRFVPVPGEK